MTRIEENTKNINVNVDTLEVNTDGLESLITTTNSRLPSALTGSGHLSISIDEIGNTGSEKLNVNLDTQISQHFPTQLSGSGRIKVESHITDHSKESKQDTAIGHLATVAGAVTGTEMQVDVVTMPTVAVTLAGGATEAKQDDGITHLSTIAGDTTSIDGKITACNTGAVVVASSALPSGAATESSLSSLNGKVSACNTGAVVVASSALPTGAATQSTLNDAEVHLGNIETSVQLIDDVVGTDGSTGPGKCISMGGTESGGNIQELLVDSDGHLQIDVLSAPSTAVTNAGLTSLAAAVNSDRVDVNIAAGGFDGAVTNAGLTALAACIGTDGDGSGPSKCISIAGTGVLGDIQEILVGGTGKLQVDISTSALPTGASTSALQGTLNTKIDTIDSQIDLLEGANTIKDVEWLSSESISNQALSSVLDTEGYERVFIYGENSSSVSANNFKIFGSNASAGTYYSVGQLAVVTSDSGRYLLREDTPVADMPSPRYLKVFNNTGSSQTITKLRAVMSHKLRYV